MIYITCRSICFALIGAISVASLISLSVFGLNISTDFTGGTLVEVTYEGSAPEKEALIRSLEDAGLSGVTVRGSESGYMIRAAPMDTDARGALESAVSPEGAKGTIARLSDIGPSIGTELRNKAILALSLVVICIVLFVAFAFRKVSEPVSSWVYGLITIVTLLHDIIVPLGAFALFGYLWGAQVDTLFITAILTVLGYSVHDTIVVFDRTRENLAHNKERNRKEPFAEVAGRAIEQTFGRSLNTSLTTLISLGALYFIGPVETQDFALTLIVGIAAGTYSSIALATPLLVTVEERMRAKKK
jgi:preprotein translocase subunit SecF